MTQRQGAAKEHWGGLSPEQLAEQSAAWLRGHSGSRIGRRQHRVWKGKARRKQCRSIADAQKAGCGRLFMGLDFRVLYFVICVTSLRLVPWCLSILNLPKLFPLYPHQFICLTLMTYVRRQHDTEVGIQALDVACVTLGKKFHLSQPPLPLPQIRKEPYLSHRISIMN